MNQAWTKIRALGSGRATTVWEGRDEALDRPVAIKELHAPLAAREGFAETYLSEARRIAALSHPRLLTIHAVDGSTDPPRLIVELAEGTVRDLIAEAPLQHERAETVLTHALEGLTALHSRGLEHRAIRPENLFYRGDGFKLGDFGIGSTAETPTLLLSSPRYVAPESLTRQDGTQDGDAAAAIDPRRDLYSLGLVLYEVLLGTRRFEEVVRDQVDDLPHPAGRSPGATVGELDLWIRFHRDAPDLPEPRELAPAIPERLSKVVARLARKNPADRYPDAQAALRELLGGERKYAARAPDSPTVHVASPQAGDTRSRLRSRMVWLAVTATVLAGTILGAFLLRPTHGFRIDLRSDPPGAEVLSRDGETRIGETPLENLLVLDGGRLLLRKDGYLDAEVLLDDPSRSVYRVTLEPEPRPNALDSPKALVEELVALAGPRDGPRLAPGGSHGTTLRLRDPIRLLLDTPRRGALVLFSISPDGTVHRLYPGPGVDRFPVEPGERLQVPLAEHVEAGFRLVATAPAGRETVFALTLEDARAKLPEGDPTPDGWLVAYPFSGPSSPAAELVRWVAEQRRQSPEATGLAFLELDVRPDGSAF